MDFNNGLYVFNGVPGLEASKGERIAKALQKLQTKINKLEQVRNSERDMSSMSGTDTEDMSLSDVRLKLLFIQIQYMRVMLRRARNNGKESSVAESEHQQLDTECAETQNCCKETQTGMSLHEIMSTSVFQTASTSHTEDTGTCISSKQIAPVKETSTSNSDAVSINNQLPCASTPPFDAISSHDQLPSESVQPSSKDIPLHYHLNIDDIPFILGSSAFESHNLIANAQNLIAKMKTHHKSLCGPRFHATQNRANPFVEKSCSQEMKDSQEKIMIEISKGFNDIQIKQSKLIEIFDNQNRDQLDGNHEKHNPHYEKEVDPKQAKKPSNASSTITNTTAAVRLKEKKQLKSTKAIKKNKHVVPTNKIRMNLPQVARQRLLRSIREVKTQLSEDDISWI